MRIRNPAKIGRESRNAFPSPFIVDEKFGKMWTIRKILNTRSTLRISSIDRSSMWVGTKYATNDGMDSNTRIPSSLFQPDDQYPLIPSCLCLTVISMIKKTVHKASMILIVAD